MLQICIHMRSCMDRQPTRVRYLTALHFISTSASAFTSSPSSAPPRDRMNQRCFHGAIQLSHAARVHGGASCRSNVRGIFISNYHRTSHHSTSYRASLPVVSLPSQSSAFLQRHCFSQKKFNFNTNPETSFLERVGLRRRKYQEERSTANMSSNFYLEGTPDDVKNAKGLHLLTMNTPNGQGMLCRHPLHRQWNYIDTHHSCPDLPRRTQGCLRRRVDYYPHQHHDQRPEERLVLEA